MMTLKARPIIKFVLAASLATLLFGCDNGSKSSNRKQTDRSPRLNNANTLALGDAVSELSKLKCVFSHNVNQLINQSTFDCTTLYDLKLDDVKYADKLIGRLIVLAQADINTLNPGTPKYNNSLTLKTLAEAEKREIEDRIKELGDEDNKTSQKTQSEVLTNISTEISESIVKVSGDKCKLPRRGPRELECESVDFDARIDDSLDHSESELNNTLNYLKDKKSLVTNMLNITEDSFNKAYEKFIKPVQKKHSSNDARLKAELTPIFRSFINSRNQVLSGNDKLPQKLLEKRTLDAAGTLIVAQKIQIILDEMKERSSEASSFINLSNIDLMLQPENAVGSFSDLHPSQVFKRNSTDFNRVSREFDALTFSPARVDELTFLDRVDLYEDLESLISKLSVYEDFYKEISAAEDYNELEMNVYMKAGVNSADNKDAINEEIAGYVADIDAALKMFKDFAPLKIELPLIERGLKGVRSNLNKLKQ